MADWGKAATGLNTLASQFMALEADRRAEEQLALTKERNSVLNQQTMQTIRMKEEEDGRERVARQGLVDHLKTITDPASSVVLDPQTGQQRKITGSEYSALRANSLKQIAERYGPEAMDRIFDLDKKYAAEISPVSQIKYRHVETPSGLAMIAEGEDGSIRQTGFLPMQTLAGAKFKESQATADLARSGAALNQQLKKQSMTMHGIEMAGQLQKISDKVGETASGALMAEAQAYLRTNPTAKPEDVFAAASEATVKKGTDRESLVRMQVKANNLPQEMGDLILKSSDPAMQKRKAFNIYNKETGNVEQLMLTDEEAIMRSGKELSKAEQRINMDSPERKARNDSQIAKELVARPEFKDASTVDGALKQMKAVFNNGLQTGKWGGADAAILDKFVKLTAPGQALSQYNVQLSKDSQSVMQKASAMLQNVKAGGRFDPRFLQQLITVGEQLHGASMGKAADVWESLPERWKTSHGVPPPVREFAIQRQGAKTEETALKMQEESLVNSLMGQE